MEAAPPQHTVYMMQSSHPNPIDLRRNISGRDGQSMEQTLIPRKTLSKSSLVSDRPHLPSSQGSPPWSALVPCLVDRRTGPLFRHVLWEAQSPLKAEVPVGCPFYSEGSFTISLLLVTTWWHPFPLSGVTSRKKELDSWTAHAFLMMETIT